MRFSHILIIIVALTAFGCKSDEPKASAEKENFENIFNKAFGMPNGRHRWNFAKDVNINVMLPDNTDRLGAYCQYNNRLYKLAEIIRPSNVEALSVNIPYDVPSIQILVDWQCYIVENTTDLDARHKNGQPVNNPWDYLSADVMPWLMVCDSPKKADFDFNDVIARFYVDGEGYVNITAMCSGSMERTWLHYFDGQTDYVVSPLAPNGYCIKTSDIEARYSNKYTWHQWFSGGKGILGDGYTINVSGSTNFNHIEGATVKFPLAVTNDYFSASLLSESTFDYDDKGMQYPRPILGFYVTEGVYDYRRKSELWEEIEDVEEPSLIETIMCIWPKGSATNMFVIPDVSELDKDEAPVGWQWPTEGSQIDYVYPYFKNWVRDASYNWFSVTPGGWPGHSASKDAEGNFVYFGYYQR